MQGKYDTTVGSFMFGMILGGVLVALMTPKNGKEVREEIKDKFDEVKDTSLRVADKVKQAGKKVSAKKDEVMYGVEDIV